MSVSKWCVLDEASDFWSPLYNTPEEAQGDLDNDVSWAWSTNARVVEVADKED